MNNSALMNQHKRAYFELVKLRKKLKDIFRTDEAYFGGRSTLVGSPVLEPLLQEFREAAIRLRDLSYRMRLSGLGKPDYYRSTQYADFAEIVPNWMSKYRAKQFYFDEVSHITWNNNLFAFGSFGKQHTGWNQLLMGVQNHSLEPLVFDEIKDEQHNDTKLLKNMARFSEMVNHSGTVSVDIETTGYSPLEGEIIEIGIVHWPAGTPYEPENFERFRMRFAFSSEDSWAIGTGPVDIHGITPDMLKGELPISDPRVQAILREYLCTGKRIIAHNLSFEVKWLTIFVPGFFESNYTENGVADHLFDSGLLPKGFLDQPTNAKLETLVTHMGFEYVEAHSALPDAMMTMLASQQVLQDIQEWGARGLRVPSREACSLSGAMDDYRALLTAENPPKAILDLRSEMAA